MHLFTIFSFGAHSSKLSVGRGFRYDLSKDFLRIIDRNGIKLRAFHGTEPLTSHPLLKISSWNFMPLFVVSLPGFYSQKISKRIRVCAQLAAFEFENGAPLRPSAVASVAFKPTPPKLLPPPADTHEEQVCFP